VMNDEITGIERKLPIAAIDRIRTEITNITNFYPHKIQPNKERSRVVLEWFRVVRGFLISLLRSANILP
jgi:hypothetical protein